MFRVILQDGAKEDRPFIVKDGRQFISEHLPRYEFFKPSGWDEHARILAPLIDLFEAVRAEVGPIKVNSGYRGDAFQERLYKQNPQGVAKPGSSPHRFGAAMDLAIPKEWTAAKLADLVQAKSIALGFDRARCGWREYSGRFLHIDLVYLLFTPFTAIPNPNRSWRPGVTW